MEILETPSFARISSPLLHLDNTTLFPIDSNVLSNLMSFTMATQGLPAYGRRLVPQVLDELAVTDPERVYAAVPKTANVKDGYQDITVADLASCVNFTAKWIEKKFGTSADFETITYIGLSDLRGIVTLLAAIKTGYKVRD